MSMVDDVTNVERLREILGFSHKFGSTATCSTFAWYGLDEARSIHLALAKGATSPLCPRCGDALDRQRTTSPEVGTSFAAFICQPCRRSLVFRVA